MHREAEREKNNRNYRKGTEKIMRNSNIHLRSSEE